MPKTAKYIIAVAVILFLYLIIFGAANSLLGWDNRAPVLVIFGSTLLFVFIWRGITRSKPKDENKPEDRFEK